MLNIALPKGRLGESVLEKFARAGYVFPELDKTTGVWSFLPYPETPAFSL